MVEVTDATFKGMVLDAGRPIVLDLRTNHCPPCDELSPVLEGLVSEWRGDLDGATVNVDDSRVIWQSVSKALPGIRGVPLTLLLRDKTILHYTFGWYPEIVDEWRAVISNVCAATSQVQAADPSVDAAASDITCPYCGHTQSDPIYNSGGSEQRRCRRCRLGFAVTTARIWQKTED